MSIPEFTNKLCDVQLGDLRIIKTVAKRGPTPDGLAFILPRLRNTQNILIKDLNEDEKEKANSAIDLLNCEPQTISKDRASALKLIADLAKDVLKREGVNPSPPPAPRPRSPLAFSKG